MRCRRLPLLAPLALLLLAGCGEARAPDAAAGAPRLRIVQPKDGQRFAVWDEVRGLGWVAVLFDVDDPGERHRVRFRVGDGAPTEVRDRHRALVRKPARGTHVLEAWLLDAEGRAVDAPGARARVTIHVGEG